DCSGWFDCKGTIEASSATLIKTSHNFDYTLVLLPKNVTTKYGFLQFRNAIPTVGERIYIPQHPRAKGKQLAMKSSVDPGGYAIINYVDQPPCQGSGYKDIGYMADTEPGSSGSPVIAYTDNLVVALHHCAFCPNRGVPITKIIEDLGLKLPHDAIGVPTK
ncbi:MAG: trypsin-like peptidase domain-containing protein, partial [bacterium]|nr:trypsin-like peptidase domain-containing protein [bacterium]